MNGKNHTGCSKQIDTSEVYATHLSAVARPLGYDHIFFYETIGSTNDEAKAFAAEAEPKETAVFWALEQSAGRGRLGRSWSSVKTNGIYISFLVRPKTANKLTLVAGGALCRALRAIGLDAKVKWPNDIYIDGRKLAGILTESGYSGSGLDYAVVGVGVNLMAVEHGSLVGKTAGIGIPLIDALDVVVNAVGAALLDEASHDAHLAYCGQHSATLYRSVLVSPVHDRESYPAVAIGIGSEGELIVRREDGQEQTVIAGEVTLREDYATHI